MGLLGLFLLRAGVTLKRLLAELGDEARRGSSTRFVPTVRAALITIVLALPIPLLWDLSPGDCDRSRVTMRCCAACRAGCLPLRRRSVPSNWGGKSAAPTVWRTLTSNGPRPLSRCCENHLRALVVVIPILEMTMFILNSGQQNYSGSSVERLVFITHAMIYACIFATLLHPGRGVFAEYLNRRREGWLFRLRFIWYPLAVALPLGLAAMAALGYFYTAGQLAIRFYVTLLLIVGSFVAYSFVVRLILIQRRRLRIAQAKRRQSAALAEQAGEDVPSLVEDLPMADLRDQSDQTRRFVVTVIVGTILLGLWFTWNNVLPALGFLERWPIWTSTQSISESYTDEAGKLRVRSRDVADPITVAIWPSRS